MSNKIQGELFTPIGQSENIVAKRIGGRKRVEKPRLEVDKAEDNFVFLPANDPMGMWTAERFMYARIDPEKIIFDDLGRVRGIE